MHGVTDIIITPQSYTQVMATGPLVDTTPEAPEHVRLGMGPVAVVVERVSASIPMTAAPYTTDVPTTLPPSLFQGFP